MPPRAQGHSPQGLQAPSQDEGPRRRRLPLRHQAWPYHSHHNWSCHWMLLLCANSGAFSKGRDSGSMIAHGEFGGLLTGGSGRTESSDITYAAPMFWL
ncbi:hypothetical protein BKA82DRAFT_4159537 [Pisolithus tinctorius]|nr:hypothetical protein BKA82DRAFT_4159537 [Pisolithus tinctorius]